MQGMGIRSGLGGSQLLWTSEEKNRELCTMHIGHQESINAMIIYRFLRNCQTCFFPGVARPWERMFPVSVASRIELCAKFNKTCQWEEVGSSRTGETTMELDS